LKALGLVPLDPVGTAVEDLQLGAGDQRLQQQRALDRRPAVVAAP
jgi:hypothetical protein